jgi:HD-GYP domain-containing protein (c-di-GMP phosphodiesterase class II)
VSIRAKQFYFIVLGQAICVAVGLWMQHQLLRSSAHQAVEEELWSDIQITAEQLLREIEVSARTTLSPGADAFEQAKATIEQEQPGQRHVTIVDRDWRTILQYPGTDSGQAMPLPPGETLAWAPCSDRAADPAGPQRGTFETPSGPQLAVACALQGGAGYLVVHDSRAKVEAGAAPLVQALLPVGAVTLLWTIVLLSITVHLLLMYHHETLSRVRARSSSDILQQTQTLVRTRDAVIFALAKLAGLRDDETGSHLERISAYCVHLASALRRHPKFSQQVTPAFIRLIGLSSVVHDIGKVGVEDSILRKPGSLSQPERRQVELHTVVAGNCLGEIAQSLGSSNFLRMAREIALAHHERWDGSGYPNGLQREAIPLSARIVAIADVYDALATQRIYKDALPHERCVATIRDAAGQQFDPDIVEVWLTIEGKFREIASEYASHGVQPKRSRFCPTGWDTEEDQQSEQAACSPASADEDIKVPTESSALP